MTKIEPSPGKIILGDCIEVLRSAPDACVDLVVTDPPYVVRYRDRSGRGILSDKSTGWIRPAFAEIYRVLKPDSFCVSFYGWNHIEKFMRAWKHVGFTPVGHIVWRKNYPSKIGFLGSRHEQAFLLAKGHPEKPKRALKDVLPWRYTGNVLHPTQKPVGSIRPLIRAFSEPNEVVLDPFAGSGTTGVAARQIKRRFILIEKDPKYHRIAQDRLERGGG